MQGDGDIVADKVLLVTGASRGIGKEIARAMARGHVHSAEGWTPEAIADHVMPVFEPSFVPLDRTCDVFKGYLP